MAVTNEFKEFAPGANPAYSSLIIGRGNVGGKARGLLFALEVLRETGFRREADHPLRRVHVPESRFLSTEAFEDLISENGLEWLSDDLEYDTVRHVFSRATFPGWVVEALRKTLEDMTYPLAVRSSSLLEDNLRYSFAGKYFTTFVPNRGSMEARLGQLLDAIRQVYASVFGPDAAEYRRRLGITAHESMGVIIQKLIGRDRGGLFYPEVAGVGFSRNYRRWSERIRKEDGMLRVVFGLGTRCTGRGYARTFSLTNTKLRPEGHNPREIAKYSQETFDALDMNSGALVSLNINERPDQIVYHPNFPKFAQVYSSRRDEIVDGRPGGALPAEGEKYIFTFAHLDKYYPEVFQISKSLFELLEERVGTGVDIEFAFEPEEGLYALVQSRPLSSYEEYRRVRIPVDLPEDSVLLRGNRMITNGTLQGCRWLVYVDPLAYAQTSDKLEVAKQVGRVNKKLQRERYILVGPGRWGSTNPRQGVKVNYSDISGAGLIVEIGMLDRGFIPELSYGTHFFADLDVHGTLYMPVFEGVDGNVFRRQWFEATPHQLAGHDAVRVYSGHFEAYLDGESMVGVVCAR